MACDLRPFRDYDEHDILNLYALNEAAGDDVTKGHMVAHSIGWKNADATTADGLINTMQGDAGAAYSNTVSQRYGVVARVGICASGGTAIGMMLYDVKETDENGEKLLFNPRKAAEMEVALSGQAVPLMTRGIVLYSGSQLITDNPALGASLYSDNAGELTTTSGGGNIVGSALGRKDDNGHVLVRINL